MCRRVLWAWFLIAALLGPAPLVAAPQAGAQSSDAQAQADDDGRIIGKILSAESSGPLPYANIMVFKMSSPRDTVGTQITGTFSLAPEGSYQVVVSPGRYRLQVSHISHKMAKSGIFAVGAGKTVTQNLRLSTTTSLVLPAIEIRSTVIRHTETAMLAKQKKAEVVADAISAEQIKKTTDSNAAEALQRVSGLSLVDNKYVFVRGMGERYSSTQINGATVGSPEPNRRVVPLDLIPANMLDNAWIVKTYSPELPAEFGGGGVNINTRDFPGNKTWSLSVASGYDVGTTSRTFLSYNGGGKDFWGWDDGTRDLPAFFKEVAGDTKVTPWSPVTGEGFKPDTLEMLGESFNKTWVPVAKKAAPRYNIEGSYGNEVSFLGQPLGVMFGGVFKTSFDTREHINNTYRPGATDDEFEVNTEYDVTTSQVKRLMSFLGSGNYRSGKNTTLHLRSMYNRIAEDEARVYEGQNHDTGAYMKNTRLRWVERILWTSNVGIDHKLPGLWNSLIEWRVDYSRAELNEPDRREYNYELRETSSGDYYELSSRGPGRGFTRMFGSLVEEERGFHAGWRIPLSAENPDRAGLRLGYSRTIKDRDLAYRRLAFKIPIGRPFDYSQTPESLLTDENIGYSPTKHFMLWELTRPEDSYEAGMEVNAAYLVLDAPLHARLRLSTGVRLEDWRQEVITKDPFASDPSREVVDKAVLAKEDWLPAVNLTYMVSASANLRAGFSRTISRPDLRELSSFTMPDYDSGFEYRGNPELRRASILNYDLRFEIYPRNQEMMAISLFYKDLKDPIENSLVSAGGQLRKVPVNAEWAHVYGLELESRVRLDRIATRFTSFGLAANLTLTDSKANVPLTSFVESGRQRERPLQGQSPYLLNLMLFYGPEEKPYACSLTYNAFGKRLSELGLEKMPDAYEQAHSSVDLALDYRLGRYKVKFTAKNIFNQRHEFTQKGFTTEAWYDERSYQLKIGMGE